MSHKVGNSSTNQPSVALAEVADKKHTKDATHDSLPTMANSHRETPRKPSSSDSESDEDDAPGNSGDGSLSSLSNAISKTLQKAEKTVDLYENHMDHSLQVKDYISKCIYAKPVHSTSGAKPVQSTSGAKPVQSTSGDCHLSYGDSSDGDDDDGDDDDAAAKQESDNTMDEDNEPTKELTLSQLRANAIKSWNKVSLITMSCKQSATTKDDLHKYRMPDKESDSSSSSSSEYSDDESIFEEDNVENENYDRSKANSRYHREWNAPPRTKGELSIDDLPHIEDLHITVPEDQPLSLLGHISSVVGKLVVIQGIHRDKAAALDADSALFTLSAENETRHENVNIESQNDKLESIEAETERQEVKTKRQEVKAESQESKMDINKGEAKNQKDDIKSQTGEENGEEKPETRKSVYFGLVFETFGPVAAPLYSVRFNSEEEIKKKNIEIGTEVYYAPKFEKWTNYIFHWQLQKFAGSDASWKNNNEPPETAKDYSDDEEERKATSRKRKEPASEDSRSVNRSTKSKPSRDNKGHQKNKPVRPSSWITPSTQQRAASPNVRPPNVRNARMPTGNVARHPWAGNRQRNPATFNNQPRQPRTNNQQRQPQHRQRQPFGSQAPTSNANTQHSNSGYRNQRPLLLSQSPSNAAPQNCPQMDFGPPGANSQGMNPFAPQFVPAQAAGNARPAQFSQQQFAAPPQNGQFNQQLQQPMFSPGATQAPNCPPPQFTGMPLPNSSFSGMPPRQMLQPNQAFPAFQGPPMFSSDQNFFSTALPPAFTPAVPGQWPNQFPPANSNQMPFQRPANPSFVQQGAPMPFGNYNPQN